MTRIVLIFVILTASLLLDTCSGRLFDVKSWNRRDVPVSEPTFVEIGQPFTFMCNAKIEAGMDGLVWFKDGIEIVQTDDNQIRIVTYKEDNKLYSELHKSTSVMADAGSYVCKASKLAVVKNLHILKPKSKPDSQKTSSKRGKENVDTTPECNIADISFVIDSSASIRPDDFKKGLEFLANFTNTFIVGPENVRVSAVTYGHKIFEHFGFDYALSNENLTEALQNLKQKWGSRTETGLAIKYMREKQMVLARPDVKKIAIVITDGQSQRRQYTIQESDKTHETNITMFAIGVGKAFKKDKKELYAIASEKKFVFTADNYNALGSIKETLGKKACAITTPAPQEQACGLRSPADVNFVFDAAYNGGPRAEKIIDFIEEVVSQKDMQEGMQVGCITSLCKDVTGFELNRYKNVSDVRAHLDTYAQSHLSQIVKQMASTGFSLANGAREIAKKIAVTFVGGKVPLNEVKQAAKAAMQNDVISYVVNLGDHDDSELLDMAYQSNKDYILSGASMTDLARKFVNHICEKETL